MEGENEGWPDKYSDPRDRPHPNTVRVTVMGFDQASRQATATARAVENGKDAPAVVTFETMADLRKVLTDRRVELLRALMSIDGAAESISVLADEVGRDYRTVHNDVSLLEQYGLLYLVEEGRAKRPYVPYERIHVDVELGPNLTDDPATA